MNRVLTVLTYIFATGRITTNSSAKSYVDNCTPVAPNIAIESAAPGLDGRILTGGIR